MRVNTITVVFVGLLSLASRAQSFPADAADAPVDIDAPVAADAPDAPVAPVAPVRRVGPVGAVELTEEGELLRGDVHLTPREFFALAGRTDLVEQSDRNLLRRRWLVGAAVAVLVASAITGAVLIATAPNMSKPYCLASVAWYNQCLDYHNLYVQGGAGTIVGGLFASTLIAALAWWSRPEVLSKRELAPLVDLFNQAR